ncbi:MAG: alpha-L-fucosidase [Lentisphaeria bacterium]|nr:alpha-L-fucosidase [Lentisphaeria bacterium]
MNTVRHVHRVRVAKAGLAVALILGMADALPAAEAAAGAETREERDARLAWWREAKFGMFIHWGVYAVPAGTYRDKQVGGIGEWIMLRARIPVAEYKAFAGQFNPVRYDPEAWAALAREAGMKYVVITSKHHDGFALFDSAVTDWDMVDATPYGKDVIAPLAEAARRHGLKFGLYYSQAQDWTHPGGAKSGHKDGAGWDDAHKGRFDDYLAAIAVPQAREILSRYQPDILWWDTPHLMTKERAELFLPLLDLRPGLITNNRLGGGYGGDSETPEQHIPATGYKDRDWETCMTINGTWGYKSYDHNWKSTETLLRNLVDIVSKGGNYLLNVGPTAEGEIPLPSVERLREVGAWMRINGEAIYGTTASPCRRPAWGRITAKAAPPGTTLYLHVFDWPQDGALLVPLANHAVNSFLLADRSRTFAATSGDRGITVRLTGDAPDPICSVVALRITGTPEALVYRLPQAADGSVALPVAEAQLHGGLRVEEKGGKPNIGFWTDAGDWAEWQMDIQTPGRFDVVAEVGGLRPTRFTIEAGGGNVTAQTEATGSYDSFRAATLGQVEFPQAGPHALIIRPEREGWQPLNLRDLTLRPVRKPEP